MIEDLRRLSRVIWLGVCTVTVGLAAFAGVVCVLQRVGVVG